MEENQTRSVISFSEALREFIGTWEYDSKLNKDIPGSVSAERIMKKAKVPLARRIGLQYFVGNDVSQSLSLDEDTGDVSAEAFVKGISAWEKIFHLDQRLYDVTDPLFGKATAHAYFDPSTKELCYVLDSKKIEKGRLMFIRKIEGDTMRMMIRWFPSPQDNTIYITHHRIYARKGPPLTMGEILQKKRRKAMLSNSVNDATKLASSIGNRMRKNSKSSPVMPNEPQEKPVQGANDTVKELVATGVPTPSAALWKSLILPLSAVLLAIILMVIIIRI